jgi:hypothetical protein
MGKFLFFALSCFIGCNAMAATADNDLDLDVVPSENAPEVRPLIQEKTKSVPKKKRPDRVSPYFNSSVGLGLGNTSVPSVYATTFDLPARLDFMSWVIVLKASLFVPLGPLELALGFGLDLNFPYAFLEQLTGGSLAENPTQSISRYYVPLKIHFNSEHFSASAGAQYVFERVNYVNKKIATAYPRIEAGAGLAFDVLSVEGVKFPLLKGEFFYILPFTDYKAEESQNIDLIRNKETKFAPKGAFSGLGFEAALGADLSTGKAKSKSSMYLLFSYSTKSYPGLVLSKADPKATETYPRLGQQSELLFGLMFARELNPSW